MWVTTKVLVPIDFHSNFFLTINFLVTNILLKKLCFTENKTPTGFEQLEVETNFHFWVNYHFKTNFRITFLCDN